MNEDGTINDGWPKFKVDEWGPNMHHEDVNTLDFDIHDMRQVFSLFFTETIVHKMITATKHTVYLQEVIYFTTWVDNKVVNMLHTMPSYQGSCTRRIKEIAEVLVDNVLFKLRNV